MNRNAAQRRTVSVPMVANALGYAGYLSVVAIVGLLASEMVGNDSWSGLPSAAATVGIALAATPLAMRSKRRGRRPGLWLGYGVGAIGGIVAILSGQSGLF